MRTPSPCWFAPACALLVAGGLVASAAAQSINSAADSAPDELENVGVAENLGGQIPLDTPFVDSTGKKVTLADCFDGRRPVILTLNYSNCPMLCSLQLNGLFDALGKLDWDIGENFQLITVSIDPEETPERAESTKQKYLKTYGRPGVEAGWHFLTGTKQNIDKVASAVGFGYRYLPEKKQYAHAAVFMVCSPDGRVTRYLYGIDFDPRTVRLALVEASDGKVGSTADQVLLYCFQYDPGSSSYVPAAYKIMRAGGIVVVMLLGGLIGGLVLVRRLRSVRARRKTRGDGGRENST